MKYQSILINTSEDLSNERLSAFLQESAEPKILNPLNTFTVEASKNSSTIGIGQLEGINEWINVKSEDTRFVIIRNAETLTQEAQNSLLKNLEEPPENTQFILVTKNSEKILETIRSRCIQLFPKGSNSDADHNIIASEILNSGYIQRLKICENLAKDFNREEISEIVFEIIKNLKRDENHQNKVSVLKDIYIGIKSGVNLKLSLDLLAINI